MILNQLNNTEQPLTPENSQEPEMLQNNNEVLIDQNVVMENIPQNQTPTQEPTNVDAPLDPEDVIPTETEIKEEFSEEVQSSDKPWVQRVGEVAKKFENQPYEEEEAAEDLQVSYMNQRFGVNIDKKDHQI